MPDRKDIRIEFKARNNLILTMMEEHKPSIESVAELCRLMGRPKQQSYVGELINMKRPARDKDGMWCPVALDLATFFRCLPEDLFSDVQQTQKTETNRLHAELAFSEIRQLMAPESSLEIEIERRQLQAVITKVLGTLTAREERVIRMRFGIGMDEAMTLEEVGQVFGFTRERVREIEAKGLRKLSHPSRNRQLRAFKPDAEWDEERQQFR